MTDFYQLNVEQQTDRMHDLATKALELWLIDDVDLDLIKMRENAVFRVTRKTGERFALRIHRHNYHSDAELRSELQWIEALDRDGLDVPPIVPNAAGDLFSVVSATGIPEPRQVDLFGWVDGEQLGTVENSLQGDLETMRRNYATVGRLAATLHNQATAWELPKGFTRHAWDADGLTGEQPLWGRFWELAALSASERDLLTHARDRVHDDLRAQGKPRDRYSLIHADFVPENLLVHGDRVRLIDFDDCGFGWHLFEIATSLYFEIGEDYFDAIKDAVIEGYRSLRALPDEQLERLPLFFLARGFTYVGWVHTRPETQTAEEMTPMLVEAVCSVAEEYLSDE